MAVANKDETLKKIRAARFIKNNGAVLRAINLLRHKYERLEEVKYALDDIEESQYVDSINYLFESGYISLRHIKNKQPADIADVDYTDLEAKLTPNGIKLLAGTIYDEMVEV